jgi:hypothetical protein
VNDNTRPPAAARLRAWLVEPLDAAGASAFRVLFGFMALWGIVRFALNGWIDRFFVRPEFFFSYWGFEWVEVLSPPAMYGLFALVGAAATCIMLGAFYRVAAVIFFAGFTYIELIDVSNYLNHYYLVSLLGLILVFLPLNRHASVDARLGVTSPRNTHPRWVYLVLRLQIALVYCSAGWAKAGPDWLLHAQPLNLWMSARTGTPLIGPLLDQWWVALAMSWAGFLFDATIALWLSIRATRVPAYLAVLVFHGLTSVFFPIGMFPVIMIVCATIFFDASWPRRMIGSASVFGPPPEVHHAGSFRFTPIAAALVALFFAVQVAMPLRAKLYYGGTVLWHEQGMRWSWRVMLREKNGSVMYEVTFPDSGRTTLVSPSRYLNSDQEHEFATQPDLIVQLAHHIADEFAANGDPHVEVRARALASLNGRAPQLLVDPSVDLAAIELDLARRDWIMPAPNSPPPRLLAP